MWMWIYVAPCMIFSPLMSAFMSLFRHHGHGWDAILRCSWRPRATTCHNTRFCVPASSLWSCLLALGTETDNESRHTQNNAKHVILRWTGYTMLHHRGCIWPPGRLSQNWFIEVYIYSYDHTHTHFHFSFALTETSRTGIPALWQGDVSY